MSVTTRCNPCSTPTPTARQFQPQKYRGHTLEILSVLAECGGMTTREIAGKTMLPRWLIYDYCRRGYLRGIFERKECWGWAASPAGLHVLDITATTTTTTTTATDTNTTQHRHKHDTNTTQTSRQLDLSAFLAREDLGDAAIVVVGVLASHYERTGQKFRIFADEYDLADKLGISLVDVRPTLAFLKEEGAIYVRRESLGWKVGLKVAFIENIDHA